MHLGRRLIKVSLPIIYLLSPLIPLAWYFQYNWYSFFHLYSLSVASGVMGYVYFLNQFVTGGRLKVFDRLYGYDRVLNFHRRMAMIGLILIIFHARTREFEENIQIQLGELSLLLFVLIAIFAVLFLSNSLSRVSIFARLREFVQRRLRLQYQHFLFIHNLTAIAMLLALAHVVLASSTQESPYRTVVMALWYCGATGAYVWQKFIRPRIHKRHPFRVTRVVHEASGIVTLEMSMPKNSNGTDKKKDKRADFAYQAGQFCFLRFLNGNMRRDEHPYSISSSPYDRTSISITAKDCGDWSANLATKAAKGDYVAVDGAYGVFSYMRLADKEASAPLIFIAGGVGITPFMSMLSALEYEKTTRPILLVWKVRTEEELFLKQRIAEWEKYMPHFRTVCFVSESQEERITVSNMCSASLSNADIEKGHYFLCGPGGMVRDCQKYLSKRGVPRKHLHSENFGF